MKAITKHLLVAIIVSASATAVNGIAGAQSRTPITACGTISTTGSYALQNDVTSSPGSDCLTISAPNTVIDLQSFRILSSTFAASTTFQPNQSVGVHILPSATNTSVNGGTFLGYAVGVQDDANSTNVSVNSASSNFVGILLNGASNSLAAISGVCAFNVVCIEVLGGSNNRVVPTQIQFDSYAVWINESSFNSIEHIALLQNQVGIYLGCNAPASFSSAKPCEGSNYNQILSNAIELNLDGIVVDKGSKNNTISGNSVNGDSVDYQYDLLDLSNNCGSNNWTGNTFLTANPSSCIH